MSIASLRLACGHYRVRGRCGGGHLTNTLFPRTGIVILPTRTSPLPQLRGEIAGRSMTLPRRCASSISIPNGTTARRFTWLVDDIRRKLAKLARKRRCGS
jgi:hypothetical protein